MGVTHLQWFLKKNPECCWAVDIKQLAEGYRSETGKEPIILVDGTNCFYNLYDFSRGDWLLGGQLLPFRKTLEHFVSCFKDIGVELIFYFDSYITPQKIDAWKDRQKTRVKEQKDIFSSLREGVLPKDRLMPPLLGACGRFLLKYVLRCKVMLSLGECDEEMARYARDKDVFAILSQDTDFVIHEGARYYLAMRSLDLKTMTTLTYSRLGLAKTLSLKPEQLPLLATLMGNDIIPYDLVQPFHDIICLGRSFDISNRVKKLANFVKSQQKGRLLLENLPEISFLVFGHPFKTNDLKQSIMSYKSNTSDLLEDTKDWEVLRIARERHMSCDLPPILYPVMRGQPYELRVGIEDLGGDLEPAAKVYLALRQKIYGILFHDDPTGQSTVDEWCVEREELPDQPLKVDVVNVTGDLHPGLLDLWTQDTPEMNLLRWEIFCRTISPRLSAADLDKVPSRLVVPAAALVRPSLDIIVGGNAWLLLRNSVVILSFSCGQSSLKYNKSFATLVDPPMDLEEWEVLAYISQAVLMGSMTVELLCEIHKVSIPDCRFVHVSSLIGRGVTTVQLLLAACGLPMEQRPWPTASHVLSQESHGSLQGKRKEERESHGRLIHIIQHPPSPSHIPSTCSRPQYTQSSLHAFSHPTDPRQFPTTAIQWEHLT
uniref:Constitutive coactivator of peroxisome proliferator-activated receptor gamma n=1 Tax=Timema bartmani TaxID=61472 RepID=A0A7R9F1Q7_9NEOP|nr:unnamed protein product [Timema bartmani]